MSNGTKGAIGAALSTLGQGISEAGARNYKEEMSQRLEGAKKAREENLLRIKNEYRLGEIVATGEQARKTAAEKPVKPNKPVKLDTRNTKVAVDAYREMLPEGLDLTDTEMLEDLSTLREKTKMGGDPYKAVQSVFMQRLANVPGIDVSSAETSTWDKFTGWVSDTFSNYVGGGEAVAEGAPKVEKSIKTLAELRAMPSAEVKKPEVAEYSETDAQYVAYGKNALIKKTQTREQVVRKIE